MQLAEHITTGRQQWLQWHADFADNLPALIQVQTVRFSMPRAACECDSPDSPVMLMQGRRACVPEQRLNF